MNDQVVIKTEKLTKTYHLYSTHVDRVKETFHPFRKKYHHTFNALEDISIQVNQGDTFGILGRNGSGKSTLLQIICGILPPTKGRIETRGKISPILELGAGFNPEFTGRQNVFIKSAILGLNREEINARFEAIAAFSEIGEFLEQPVKTYSTGMYVRLAFAVAIHVDAAILVIDEALAVGDAAFQYKCFRHLEKMQENGTTILFVSHDVGTVKKLCNRAIWLKEGRLHADADPISVADQYHDFIRKESARHTGPGPGQTSHETDYFGRTNGVLLEIGMVTESGREISEISTGENVEITVTYELYEHMPEGIILGIAVYRSDYLYVCGLNTGLDGFDTPCNKGIHKIKLKFPNISLLPGSYFIQSGLYDRSGMVIWDFRKLTKEFMVRSGYTAEGLIRLPHEWDIVDG